MMNSKQLMLIISLTASLLDARYVFVKNSTQFDHELKRSNYVVACFFSTSHHHRKNINKDHENIIQSVRQVAQTPPYDTLLKHNVGFVMVDLAHESLYGLRSKYHIDYHELPQCILFKAGKRVMSVDHQVIKLVGFADASIILDFIDTYFGREFDVMLSAKDAQQRSEKEILHDRYAYVQASRYPDGHYAPYNPNGFYTWYGYKTFYGNGPYWGNQFYVP